MLAGTDKDLSLEKNILSVQFFYVSNIAYIANENDYFVLNRETGQPLQATEVQVWYRYYDGNKANTWRGKVNSLTPIKMVFFISALQKKERQ